MDKHKGKQGTHGEQREEGAGTRRMRSIKERKETNSD